MKAAASRACLSAAGSETPPTTAKHVQSGSGNTGVDLTNYYLLLEFCTQSIGLLQEDGVLPKKMTKRRKLVEAPLVEGV